MASRDPEDSTPSDTGDPFLLKIAFSHKQLDTCFNQYQLSLQERKQTLTNELNRVETEYRNSRKNYKEKRRILDEFHSTVKLQCETFKSLEHTLLTDVEKQIKLLEEEFPEKDVNLFLDAEFSEKIERLGKVEVDVVVRKPITPPEEVPLPPLKKAPPESSYEKEVKKFKEPRDFSAIKGPILCAVEQGDESADLKYPQRLAVDPKSGFIFIADQTSHSVKIFSQEGVYKGKVVHNSSINRHGTGSKVELVHPFGVCFYKDALYVTSHMEQNFNRDFQPCVFKFEREKGIDFKYSLSTGTRGPNIGQFNCPKNITADPSNGDLYVWDYKSRVQILDKNLNFLRVEAESGIIDIHFFGDKMYKLTGGYKNPLQVIDQFGVQNMEISIGYSPQQIFISELGKMFYIISPYEKNIHIGRPESCQYSRCSFKTLHSLEVKGPQVDFKPLEIRGMALDESTQKIIIVVYSKNNMLQIY